MVEDFWFPDVDDIYRWEMKSDNCCLHVAEIYILITLNIF